MSLSLRATGADEPLPVTRGLVLRLDAAREAIDRALDATTNEGRPSTDVRLDRWSDLSGNDLHAVQRDADRRPTLLRVGDAGPGDSPWVVRFDGVDDNLRILGMNRRFTDFTLFVVAAPHSNLGGFRGLLSFNQQDRRDYETGFNLDMNFPHSAVLENLNLEGPGFGGARDLLPVRYPMETLHLLDVVVDSRAARVTLGVDGREQGSREFAAGELIADELTIGARHYENGPGAQRVQGFLHGDIVEVLLYDRVLSAEDLETMRGFLEQKHAALTEALPRQRKLARVAENVERLVPVDDPPPVQMLLPGFSVKELPIELNNINNVRYRSDGKLYALGYDGDIWLLRDENGDGLEDTADRFFENRGRLRGPIGMAVIPADHALLVGAESGARGVVVASKGKVSAILDLDGDDVAEIERVIASGWKEIPQNVDAVGVAIDPRRGGIYFGLGTAAYNNAYLVDADGRSAFDLNSDRGTIQRIKPDLSGRETICTGVRFTIGMDFDAQGELFVTDQEGATWLPNGNPFDELLHIRRGRHYGFPPRHVKHLPDVFDEPSEFDYGPQHQSTCGMVFNLPLDTGGPIFGPDAWRGDAIVTGESRGKLYRTRLVRNRQGHYVARNHLIGCLDRLTVDCCLSPRGDLIVACHGGGPDWGTGPSGKGSLFRIRYEDREAPQPVAVWPTGRQEVRVAFDRPLDPLRWRDLAARTSITFGRYVAAADRFETIRPGYAVTQLQQTTPRYRLPVYSVGISADRRSLVFSTAPHVAAVSYALTLPDGTDVSTAEAPRAGTRHPQIDLAYSLHGISATWRSRNERDPTATCALSHLDLHLARQLPLDPAQNRFFGILSAEGTLTLATVVDPSGIFLPRIQPGSRLDYDPADDRWIGRCEFQLTCDRPFHASVGESDPRPAVAGGDASYRFQVPIEYEDRDKRVPIRVSVETGGEVPSLRFVWSVTPADGTERTGTPALDRFVLPWAEVDSEAIGGPREREIPELADASWGRGRSVFRDEEIGCAKCHVARGSDGGRIGPDLSNLLHRDYESVLRDVNEPGYAINPDYVTFGATMQDGRVLGGTVRSDGDDLLIGDKDGKETRVRRSDIEQLTPLSTSVMPDDLTRKLGPERTDDLLAFLLKPAPRMPTYANLPPPPPRTRAEVSEVLQGSKPSDGETRKPLNVLLVAGAKDHGVGEHDYPAWLKVWSELMAAGDRVTVDTAMEWPADKQIEAADTIVFYQKGSWNAERARAIDAHLAKGGGLVYIHWAVEGGPEAPEFARRIGLASQASRIKFRHGPLDLGFSTGAEHPIGRNFDEVHFHDESYWLMIGDRSRIRVIASGVEEEQPRPLFWTLEPGRGRVFVSILGHYSWTFDDPLFRVLLLRGIAWSAGEDVDRFNDLVLLGARLKE